MSKKKIEAALRRKGLSCVTLEYTHQVTPGEVVGGWEIELDERSEELVAVTDPGFNDWEPDCFNTSEALEWVASLPNCQPPPPQKKNSGVGVKQRGEPVGLVHSAGRQPCSPELAEGLVGGVPYSPPLSVPDDDIAISSVHAEDAYPTDTPMSTAKLEDQP